MAHLFRPSYTRPIPEGAKRLVQKGGIACVRWKGRGGATVTGIVSGKDPARCRVKSDRWWIEYTDERGEVRRIAAFVDRVASEQRLAEIVRRVERTKAGILESSDDSCHRPITVLAGEYRDHLEAKGLSAVHVSETHRLALAVAHGCEWSAFSDLDSNDVVAWLDARRRAGMSVETGNHHVRAAKAFASWLAARFRVVSPLAALKCSNAGADRRYIRGSLSDEQFEKLIQSTSTSSRVKCLLNGMDRAALYVLAAATGLRASELASLEPRHFQWDPPSVTVEARHAKNRTVASIPLSVGIALQIHDWVRLKGSAPLWPGGWAKNKHAAEILRLDLLEAGLPTSSPEGKIDFHSLRSRFAMTLIHAGISLPVVQKLMRHSTPHLTAKHYIRMGLEELAAAVNAVPTPRLEQDGIGKKT